MKERYIIKTHDTILILDFGSQYNQLIARRVRECSVYSVLKPYNTNIEEIKKINPKGIILSGGPNSVYDENSPQLNEAIFELDIPILGICYGMQAITKSLGGTVEKSDKREYGFAEVSANEDNPILKGVFYGKKTWSVWMSHSDRVTQIPKGFTQIGFSDNTDYAIIENKEKQIWGVQFHPEVEHTDNGRQFLRNFVVDICKANPDWTATNFIDESVEIIRKAVGDKKAILGFSGGVDSSVAAMLMSKAIGDKLICIFVDNGLLRLNEREQVENTFKKHFGLNLITVDAEESFLSKLKDVTDPEAKRKVIGKEFIEVFQSEVDRVLTESGDEIEYLVQGTIYPDVIESVSAKGGPSATIKSHHNVGGLPEDMKLKVIEPLRDLFKDEVRNVGRALGLPDKVIDRHPFPGPGLGVRVLEEVTKEKCDILRKADAIFIEEIEKAGIYKEIGQAFAVFLPIRSVGVMGDNRTYENAVALRAVRTIDFMTADWYPFNHDFLKTVSTRIINEVSGINRVVYDVSSKPPSTIEWE